MRYAEILSDHFLASVVEATPQKPRKPNSRTIKSTGSTGSLSPDKSRKRAEKINTISLQRDSENNRHVDAIKAMNLKISQM